MHAVFYKEEATAFISSKHIIESKRTIISFPDKKKTEKTLTSARKGLSLQVR